MRKAWEFFKHEFFSILPGWTFFFIVAIVYQVNRYLILADYGVHYYPFMRAFVVGAIFAKILLVVDHFKFINRYPHRPLIYNTVWKTGVYFICGLVVQYLEPVVHFLIEGAGFIEANQKWWAALQKLNFLNAQIWVIMFMFLFCAMREIIRTMGREKFREMFLGPKKKME